MRAYATIHHVRTDRVLLDLMTALGRVLADPTRASILLFLMLGGVGYPSNIADQLGLTRSNVSNHLAHLRRSGLLEVHAEGRRTRYEVVDDAIASALADLLETLLPTSSVTTEGGDPSGMAG
jgi:DNA-binding transcriptional ArsR family regulator